MSAVLGIDPGAKGGMVSLHPQIREAEESPCVVTKFANMTPFDITTAVAETAEMVDVVVLEEVGARPGEGATRAFSQGRNFGLIEGASMATCRRLILVKPNAWQRAIGCPTTRKVPKPSRDAGSTFYEQEAHEKALKLYSQAKARAKRDHKNDLKAMAQRLFPRERITLDTCDAYLLAFYALTIELPKLRGEPA